MRRVSNTMQNLVYCKREGPENPFSFRCLWGFCFLRRAFLPEFLSGTFEAQKLQIITCTPFFDSDAT